MCAKVIYSGCVLVKFDICCMYAQHSRNMELFVDFANYSMAMHFMSNVQADTNFNLSERIFY